MSRAAAALALAFLLLNSELARGALRGGKNKQNHEFEVNAEGRLPGDARRGLQEQHEAQPRFLAYYPASLEADVVLVEALAQVDAFALSRGWLAEYTAVENLGKWQLSDFGSILCLFTPGDLVPFQVHGALEAHVTGLRGGFASVGCTPTYDTKDTWPWYTSLLLASTTGEAGEQEAIVFVEDGAHAASNFITPRRWSVQDGLPNYSLPPDFRKQVHVLASLDESSFVGGNSPLGDHPISWCAVGEQGLGARIFHTGLGNSAKAWASTDFVSHVEKGLGWTLRMDAGDCMASLESSFVKTPIVQLPKAIRITTAPSGELFVARREGELMIHDTNDGTTVQAGKLQVGFGVECGLIGLEVSPAYTTLDGGYVYLYYCPSPTVRPLNPETGIPNSLLSRFVVRNKVLDLQSEVVLLENPSYYEHHPGGMLKWDSGGRLWMAFGDDSMYTPYSNTDPSNRILDSRAASANSNTLLGGFNCIIPNESDAPGTPLYSCCEESLQMFPNQPNSRCEVAAKGFRSIFNFGVHPKIPGKLYSGECGPDAGYASGDGQPAGSEEWLIIDVPSFHGWPYCTRENVPYRDISGMFFDCNDCGAIVNDSPYNDGLLSLGYACTPDKFWWTRQGETSLQNPGLAYRSDNIGVCAMGGIGFDLPADTAGNECALPRYFQDNAMFVEWARGLLNLGILDEKGDVMKLVPLWTQYDEYKGPLSFTIDNEGVLYILEWGKWDTTYAGALSGTGATISKMCYTGATEFVTAVCSVNIAAGPAPLSVKFDGSKSLSPAQASLAYSWDVDGDGLQDFADSVGSYVFTEQGLYSASLTVTSATGLTDTCVVDISVGNEPPVVTYRSPAVDRGFFCFNELFVSAEVSDVEDGSTRDGSISCDLVQADHILGHAEHGHNGGNIRLDNFTTPSEHAVCASTTPTSIGAHNLRTEDIFWAVELSYEDQGFPPARSTKTSSFRILYSPIIEAENFREHSKDKCRIKKLVEEPGCIERSLGSQEESFLYLSSMTVGDWTKYGPFNPFNMRRVALRASSAAGAGQIDLVAGANALAGEIVASWVVPEADSEQEFTTVVAPLKEVNQIISFDLGADQAITGITLLSGSADNCPVGYQIFIRDAAGQHVLPPQAVAQSSSAFDCKGGLLSVVFSPVMGRYMDFMQTGDSDMPWVVQEATVTSTSKVNHVVRSVTASYNNELASRMVDGLASTSWSVPSQRGGPYNFFLRWGSSVSVDNFVFIGEGVDSTICQSEICPTPDSCGSSVRKDLVVPGHIEMESYDEGGNGFAYLDVTGTNSGSSKLRGSDAVDLAECNACRNGYTVTDRRSQEWMRFTLSVMTAGDYEVYIVPSNSSTASADSTISFRPGPCFLHGADEPACLSGGDVTFDASRTPFYADKMPLRIPLGSLALSQGNQCMEVCSQVDGAADLDRIEIMPLSTTCGNGAIEGVEACEAGITETHTCVDLGYECGTVGCISCALDALTCYQKSWSKKYAVNSGGWAITYNLVKFDADAYFEGGQISGAGGLIATERYGDFSYVFPDLELGVEYKVTFFLAEIFQGVTGVGQRVFDILIGGDVVFPAVDPLALAGEKNVATERLTHTFVARDPVLSITFGPITELPKITAILIEERLCAADILAPAASSPPTVSVTAPKSEATFALGSPVELQARAVSSSSDSTAEVQVDFFVDGKIVVAGKYSAGDVWGVVWVPDAAGIYAIEALASNAGEDRTISAPVTIKVIGSVEQQIEQEISLDSSGPAMPSMVQDLYVVLCILSATLLL